MHQIWLHRCQEHVRPNYWWSWGWKGNNRSSAVLSLMDTVHQWQQLFCFCLFNFYYSMLVLHGNHEPRDKYKDNEIMIKNISDYIPFIFTLLFLLLLCGVQRWPYFHIPYLFYVFEHMFTACPSLPCLCFTLPVLVPYILNFDMSWCLKIFLTVFPWAFLKLSWQSLCFRGSSVGLD